MSVGHGLNQRRQIVIPGTRSRLLAILIDNVVSIFLFLVVLELLVDTLDPILCIVQSFVERRISFIELHFEVAVVFMPI